jgi:hypothetical protein
MANTPISFDAWCICLGALHLSIRPLFLRKRFEPGI